MAVPDTSKRLEEAKAQAKDNPSQAEATYRDILRAGPGKTDASGRDFEAALMGLGNIFKDAKRANDLADLVANTRSELSTLPKAKTAKLGTHLPPCPSHPS